MFLIAETIWLQEKRLSSPEAPRRMAEPMLRKVSLPQAQEMRRRSRRSRRSTPPTTSCQ